MVILNLKMGSQVCIRHSLQNVQVLCYKKIYFVDINIAKINVLMRKVKGSIENSQVEQQ